TAPVLLFLSAFFLILPFTMGEPALRLGPVPISAEGFGLATLLVVKGAAIVLLSLAMLGTAPFDRSVRALRDLRAPRRLAELLLFSYRYLFVLLGDLERLRRGLAARNFAAARGARAWEARGNLLGVLLVRSFERTEKIQRAMEARGYDGTLPSLAVFRLGPRDVAKTALAFAAAAALALL
ncbi:MAG: energy-coupling factor transporter transmembrane protein EcfT, partial [Candidatus Methylomirabilis sp.]|nr:energy-coupling factor transporter transmembrane protein EcfT [Deltaproteobacteria bacterium]